MKDSKVIGLGAAGVVAAVVALAVVAPSEKKPREFPRVDRRIVLRESPIDAKVTWLDDGTKIYQLPLTLIDGGLTYEATTEAPCKRRPHGATRCYRMTERDGGQGLEDVAEFSRYPAAQMTGTECEGVACSVFAGVDPDAPEEPAK